MGDPSIKIDITAMCYIVSKWGRKKEGEKKRTGTVAVRFLIDSNIKQDCHKWKLP